jgi:phage tail sheath protein FI
LIFTKKEISRIANTILFEPNVQATWDRFTSAVNPFLADVKARFGLTDFRVVLDNTTTTDDLIDRNTLYAKIYLKPARAIEFIALDFIITRTGASFED